MLQGPSEEPQAGTALWCWESWPQALRPPAPHLQLPGWESRARGCLEANEQVGVESQSHALPCAGSAKRTAGSSSSAVWRLRTWTGPRAGGDPPRAPALLLFQRLRGPRLCPGQGTGGGGHCFHPEPRLGFVLRGGPAPHRSRGGEGRRPRLPSWLGKASLSKGGQGGARGSPPETSPPGPPWCPVPAVHSGLPCSLLPPCPVSVLPPGPTAKAGLQGHWQERPGEVVFSQRRVPLGKAPLWSSRAGLTLGTASRDRGWGAPGPARPRQGAFLGPREQPGGRAELSPGAAGTPSFPVWVKAQ